MRRVGVVTTKQKKDDAGKASFVIRIFGYRFSQFSVGIFVYMRARAGVLHAPFGVYVVDIHEFVSIFRYSTQIRSKFVHVARFSVRVSSWTSRTKSPPPYWSPYLASNRETNNLKNPPFRALDYF